MSGLVDLSFSFLFTNRLPSWCSFVAHPHVTNGDDSDEECGIQFTARAGSNFDVSDSKEAMKPVALECQLPWKRSACPQETEPVSSIASHQLPNDNVPELAQLPSWADNLDYNHIPAISPRPSVVTPTQNGRLNTSNNNSGSQLETVVEQPTKSIPLIPTITIDSPAPSTNNLLAADPYTAVNGSADLVSFELQSNSSSSDSPTNVLPETESEDDEEVEIKPFGKVHMSSNGSAPKLSGRRSPPTNVRDQSADERNGNAVVFSLNDENSSEEDNSMFTPF